MAAYFVVEIVEVTDPEKMDAYRARAPATVAHYGGRPLVRRGRPEVVEGDWRPNWLTILEFPTLADLQRWYDSEEYQEILPMRTGASRANAVSVEGV